MAVRHGYGKIAGADALVFAYDTGDTRNSYKGEPTTNLALFNIASSGFGTDTPSNLTQTSNDTEFTYKGRPSRKMVIGEGYWNCYIFSYNSSVSSTVFTVSFKVKAADGSNPSTFIGGGYIYGTAGSFFPSPSFTAIDDGWYICYIRYSGTAMTLTSLTGVNGSGGPKTFYITDYQAEAKDHFTPFTPGNTTRSSTQGLLDLTGNKTIDLSNVSFDSNAQLDFDGTNDYIDLGSDQVIKTSGGWTVESVVYYDAVAGEYNNITSPANFIGSDNITYNSWYWSVLSNKLALWNSSPGIWKYGSTTLQPNTWYHAVLVSYDNGTQYQMYLNGVAEGGDHTTYSWNPDYSGLQLRYIGRGNSANVRVVNGKIPVTKIYNRALTAAEVKNNFNNYKGRFNL